MPIETPKTSTRTEYTEYIVKAGISDMPRLTSNRTGAKYEVRGVILKWTWSECLNLDMVPSVYTNRDVSLIVHKVLKSGKVSVHPTRQTVNDVPEWLAAFVAEHTPAGYTAAVAA